jgi:hypothetical protein
VNVAESWFDLNSKEQAEGISLNALANDFAAMVDDGLLAFEQPTFASVLAGCKTIQDSINQTV